MACTTAWRSWGAWQTLPGWRWRAPPTRCSKRYAGGQGSAARLPSRVGCSTLRRSGAATHSGCRCRCCPAAAAAGPTCPLLVPTHHSSTRKQFNPRTYIGSGKVQELKSALAGSGATTVIFDDELSPGACVCVGAAARWEQRRCSAQGVRARAGGVLVAAVTPPRLRPQPNRPQASCATWSGLWGRGSASATAPLSFWTSSASGLRRGRASCRWVGRVRPSGASQPGTEFSGHLGRQVTRRLGPWGQQACSPCPAALPVPPAQVELAQSEYQLPRLTRMWSHLERQSGSGQVRCSTLLPAAACAALCSGGWARSLRVPSPHHCVDGMGLSSAQLPVLAGALRLTVVLVGAARMQ